MPGKLKSLLAHLLRREERERPSVDEKPVSQLQLPDEQGHNEKPGLPPSRPTHARKHSHSSELSLSHLRPLPIVLKAFRRQSSDSTATSASASSQPSQPSQPSHPSRSRLSQAPQRHEVGEQEQVKLSLPRPSPVVVRVRRSTSPGRSSRSGQSVYLSARAVLSPSPASPLSLSLARSQLLAISPPLVSPFSSSGSQRSRISRASRPGRPASRTSVFTLLSTWSSNSPQNAPSSTLSSSFLPPLAPFPPSGLAHPGDVASSAQSHHLQPWGKKRLRPRPALEDVFGPLVLPAYTRPRSRRVSAPAASGGGRSWRLAPPKFWDECPTLPELEDMGGFEWPEFDEDEESPTHTLNVARRLSMGPGMAVAFPSCSPEGMERLKEAVPVHGGTRRRLISMPLA